MDENCLKTNLDSVRDRIASAARRAGREPEEVRLVAVTKRNPTAWVRPLVKLGQRDLGENYPQELWKKAEELEDLAPRWHLIGHLQRNKARRTYPMVRMVHSVDSLRLLRAIDRLAAEQNEPAAVCLQVNCTDEPAKHGWAPEAILNDAETIAAFQHVPIVGLMTMAAFGTDAEGARPAFEKLRVVRDDLRERSGLVLNELSMGMSNDFEVAIAEGATWVRVGSALFEGVAH